MGVGKSLAVAFFVATAALAASPQWYVKKGTWEETLEASQQAWQKAQATKPKATPLPDFGKDDLTILAWVRTRQAGTIVAKAPAQGDWTPQGKTLYIRGGKPTLDVGWVGAVSSNRNIADNQWHHVALVKKGKAVTHFVDGALAGGGKLDFGPDPKSAVLKVGFTCRNFPKPSPFRGLIDDLRIYRRALPPEEIQAHAKSLQPPKAQGLAACWPFDGNLDDATGGGNDGRPVGRVAFAEGKHGKALSLDGRAHLVIGVPASFEGLIWPLLERDFGVVRLFDGASTAGWRRRNRPGHGWGAVWEVADGAITGVQEWPGSWGMFATTRAFDNCELILEVKTDWPLDAAVLLRESGFGRAWQVNIHTRDDGDVGGITTCEVEGPSVAAKDWRKLWKKDDWNELRITIKGDPPTIQTWLNGQPMAKLACKKTPDLLNPSGSIGLVVSGSPEAFNNRIYVRKAILRKLK